MCKAYNGSKVDTPVMMKQKLAQTREGQTRGRRSRSGPASAAEGTLGRGTRRAATSTDYGGPATRRRRVDDGEVEQTRRG